MNVFVLIFPLRIRRSFTNMIYLFSVTSPRRERGGSLILIEQMVGWRRREQAKYKDTRQIRCNSEGDSRPLCKASYLRARGLEFEVMGLHAGHPYSIPFSYGSGTSMPCPKYALWFPPFESRAYKSWKGISVLICPNVEIERYCN